MDENDIPDDGYMPSERLLKGNVFITSTLEERVKEFNEPKIKLDLNEMRNREEDINNAQSEFIKEEKAIYGLSIIDADDKMIDILVDLREACIKYDNYCKAEWEGSNIETRIILEAVIKGFQQALTKHVEKIVSKHIKLLKDTKSEGYKNYVHSCILKMDDMNNEMEDMKRYKINKKDIYGYWICVSPDEKNQDAYELLEKNLKLACKKGTQEIIFNMEQRGTTEETRGRGIHSHILMKYSDKEGNRIENKHVKYMLKNVYGKLGDIKNEHFIFFKPVTKEQYEKKLQYVKGIKKEKSKMYAVAQDKIWRETLGIQEMYSSIK